MLHVDSVLNFFLSPFLRLNSNSLTRVLNLQVMIFFLKSNHTFLWDLVHPARNSLPQTNHIFKQISPLDLQNCLQIQFIPDPIC